MAPEPKILAASELHVGLVAEFERDVTEDDVLSFARLSGDWNPLHVDADYARATNYEGRLVHGAFQFGLASAMIGMHLPGRSVLFGEAHARFPAPLYFPGRVRVRGEISAWNADDRRGSLDVLVREASSLVTTAEIRVSFTLHEQREEAVRLPPVDPSRDARALRLVLVTGAGGGLGRDLVAHLARDFAVLAMVHRGALDESLARLPNVVEVRADMNGPAWEDAVGKAIGERELYGVVHAAWPGLPTGGLLATPDDVIERQVAFGTTQAVRLSRLLFAKAGEQGRMIVLGSIAGTQRPTINAAAYSLGKAALEHTVRLLAPELARKRITINAVCPNFVAAGMNKQSGDRQRMKEAAQIPMGRLCAADDVAALVAFLLSPSEHGSAFVSGAVIGLNGGQL